MITSDVIKAIREIKRLMKKHEPSDYIYSKIDKLIKQLEQEN